MPARVWRELWPVLDDEITLLFARSLETGMVPKEWKIAKIVPLQKPKRKDYTMTNNYRPISLLPTAYPQSTISRPQYDPKPDRAARSW